MTDYNKIIKLLLECSPWPWKKQDSTNPEFSSRIIWTNKGPGYGAVAEVDNLDIPDSQLISLAPQVITELIVKVVEQKATVSALMEHSFNTARSTPDALRELSIDPDLYRQLKERMEATK